MAAETFRPNFYASAAVDRLGHLRRDEQWIAQRLADPATRILPVWRTHNLVIAGGTPSACPIPRPVSCRSGARIT